MGESRLNDEQLTRERLCEVLTYEPLTGTFRWKLPRNSRISVGDIAGTNHAGYVMIGVDNRQYMAHRLAWLYMTGAWPHLQIDHRDLCRGNNAWTNLREASGSQNRANTGARAHNRIGIKGVFQRRNGRFGALIRQAGRNIHLGTFDSAEAAHAAYLSAAERRYGEFARASS